jgi:hypothetical protein
MNPFGSIKILNDPSGNICDSVNESSVILLTIIDRNLA